MVGSRHQDAYCVVTLLSAVMRYVSSVYSGPNGVPQDEEVEAMAANVHEAASHGAFSQEAEMDSEA